MPSLILDISFSVPGGKPFLEKFCEKSTYAEVDVFTYMSQTLKALHYLHATAHLVHLDLKPENVILDSKCNAVKLIDFGCAQALARIVAINPKNKHLYQSTEFLAPELLNQQTNRLPGTHTDMWAFAVLLYVALR